MNIFVLDENVERCARFHHDQHVVKMVLESTQMLCTVVNKFGLPSPYRPTHVHHPCTLWAGESLSNWRWLQALTRQLNFEYRFRFERDRDHRSAIVAASLPEPPLEELGLTEFAQAMPAKYKVAGDAVAAYRSFYLGEKLGTARWTRRSVPDWIPPARLIQAT